MNRQIKFRGKRKDNGEWVYGFIWQKLNPHKEENEYLDKAFMQTGVNINTWHEVDPETVGQFTGLVIKEREVYQGDLFQYRDGSDSCHFEIVWDNQRLAWDYKRIEDGELMYNHYDFGLLEDSEYIGTIHEDE